MDKKTLSIVASFENASILRKFTILFIVASIIPMGLLFYIYYQHKYLGHIDIPDYYFTYAMILTVLGVFIGYYSIRSLLSTVINITKENRKIMEHLLNPDIVKDLDRGENEIEILSRSFSVVTKQLEQNIHSLENAKKTLHSVMAKVGQGISNMEKIDTFLDLIVETMNNALNGKASTLLVLNDSKTELTIKTVYGAPYDWSNPVRIKLGPGSPFAKILEIKRPLTISGIFLKNNPKLSELFTESLLCVPLLYKDKINGIITLSKGNSEPFSEEDINLTFNLACQTAVALENSKLNNDIEKTYFETISALALAVDAKDKYSRGHLDRVAEYATMTGKRLGLDEHDLKILRDGARLHDLGKIGIPDEILSKEQRLTDDEWVIMRRHPEIGESIIKPVRSLAGVCDLIRHHHERIDGTGYPDGLKEEEISPLVRILSVADMYDALTTERPYRAKKSKEEAFQVLRSMKGTIDQDIVEVFMECLGTSPAKIQLLRP
jgi:HD-GYP domain-containing protein (c-di-GMP phosphodiesterase class II)